MWRRVGLFLLVLSVFLTATATAFAQEAVVEEVWYWGIEAETATLVAYNVQGVINHLDVPLNPLDPQALIWRVDARTALALVDVDGKLVLYELTADSAQEVAAFGS